jgi:tetratricopeptide (TPR) repeat protein
VATGDQRGVEYLREALTVLNPITNPLETANALSIEGRFHHLAGRHKQAIELLEQAAALVEPAAAADEVSSFAASIISQIYAYTAGAYQHSGLYEDADRWARRAIEFGEAHNVLIAQALGFEFLSEDAINLGDHLAGVKYAEREIEIADKLHSRERRSWAQFGAAMNAMGAGDPERAEREFREGIALAESIGELRVGSLMKGNLATLEADQGELKGDPHLLDKALQTAQENFKQAESIGLFYSRADARRCLAHVKFRRGEVDEAERLCAETLGLVEKTESRIIRLWLGPLYIQVLLALSERARAEGESEKAASRSTEAADHLARYTEFVARCQSPRFKREAIRLAGLLQNYLPACRPD